MRKTVFIYGIIAGFIASSLFIGYMLLGKEPEDNFENGMLYGYTLMILGFSLIFVATKITRDKYNGGVISFGKAFLVGLYITLIASTFYVIVWMIDFHFFVPDFAEKYAAHMTEQLKTSGASLETISKSNADMAEFSVMYKNPFFRTLLTYVEILPVGLLVSLISAMILKRKG